MTDDTARVTDEDWMRAAIAEALRAEAKGEVPVGAVVVHEGEIKTRRCTPR